MNRQGHSAIGTSDEEIVQAVLKGDRDAYGVLVARHQRSVAGALWRLTGNRSTAEELTQETFVRAYFALGSYRPTYQFATWLHRIAHNLAINVSRRERRQVGLDDGDFEDALAAPDVDPAERAERAEAMRAVWEAVSVLAPEFRQIILMRHVDEMSYQEIVEATGLPIGTVKSRIARGRRQLVALLGTRRSPVIGAESAMPGRARSEERSGGSGAVDA